MRVLVACEYSGTVRDAFRALKHDAWSCDLLPSDVGGPHIQGDALEAIRKQRWDLLIAHPPCTYLCNSGLHWNKRVPGREQKTIEALAFFEALLNAPVPRVAIENPIGKASTVVRKPDQIIQPYEFGHDASKATCLWLRNLPLLQPTKHVEPRWVMGPSGVKLPRWSNQTDSGQNKLPPSKDRWKIRSTTYAGIAVAMADQWGRL